MIGRIFKTGHPIFQAFVNCLSCHLALPCSLLNRVACTFMAPIGERERRTRTCASAEDNVKRVRNRCLQETQEPTQHTLIASNSRKASWLVFLASLIVSPSNTTQRLNGSSKTSPVPALSLPPAMPVTVLRCAAGVSGNIPPSRARWPRRAPSLVISSVTPPDFNNAFALFPFRLSSQDHREVEAAVSPSLLSGGEVRNSDSGGASDGDGVESEESEGGHQDHKARIGGV